MNSLKLQPRGSHFRPGNYALLPHSGHEVHLRWRLSLQHLQCKLCDWHARRSICLREHFRQGKVDNHGMFETWLWWRANCHRESKWKNIIPVYKVVNENQLCITNLFASNTYTYAQGFLTARMKDWHNHLCVSTAPMFIYSLAARKDSSCRCYSFPDLAS